MSSLVEGWNLSRKNIKMNLKDILLSLGIGAGINAVLFSSIPTAIVSAAVIIASGLFAIAQK